MEDQFRAGITACLRSWSALRTAVESGWGGVESSAKADDLRRNLYEVFHLSADMDQHGSTTSAIPTTPISRIKKPSMSVEDIEDNLAIYMEEEFSVVLEDSSEKQIADILWRMYEGYCRGDMALALQLIQSSEEISTIISTIYPVQVQSTEHDDEDEEEDDIEAMETDDNDALTTSTAVVSNNTTEISSAIMIKKLQEQKQEQQQQQQLQQQAIIEYVNGALFGGIDSTTVKKKNMSPPPEPVRQLGEAKAPEKAPIEMDEDGFAPVTSKRRKPRK